ncbi:MAG: sigma-54-dependent transcriptional regulator [Vulcanimicrobiota bacterium]
MTRQQKESILVVDDSDDTLEILERNLSSQGFAVHKASSVEQAVDSLGFLSVDLVITDLKMPRVGGLDLVRHVRENYRDMEVMVITGYPSIDGAVKAMKTGAEEYLAKPFTNEELFEAVRRALEKLEFRRAGQHTSPGRPPVFSGLIGESPVMEKVYKVIFKAAKSSANVLITGESGTGKELVARAIHYSSGRASCPFVTVNCGAVPEGLLESELFGHMKGAFTGATESRAGFFLTADGGTIFLDEIGNTSLSMQARLLRVLQDKEICMVGSSRSRHVDVRIVAASNRDLQSLVDKELFRQDLLFRIQVITLNLPPLRERGNDILTLISHFALKFSREAGKASPRFSMKVLDALKQYSWPGNVRELENVIQQLIVLSDEDVIDITDLPAPMRYTVTLHEGVERTLQEVEESHIRKVLEYVKGNKSRAAAILGIDRKTLRDRIRLIEEKNGRALS